MEDDDEDFEALFFAECGDLLTDLDARLGAMAAGDADPETLHAAFRAVHSIKGGAAAFGFAALAEFAHAFEAVMDRLRGGALDRSAPLAALLIRAGDTMSALIEAARARTAPPAEQAAAVAAQLAGYAGGDADAPAADAPDAAALDHTDDDDAAPPAAGAGATTPTDAAPEPEPPEIVVEVRPGPDFIVVGLDPLRMIRTARAVGLAAVEPLGDVPPIDAFNFGACPLGWRLTFRDADRAAITGFFEVYADHVALAWSGDPDDDALRADPEPDYADANADDLPPDREADPGHAAAREPDRAPAPAAHAGPAAATAPPGRAAAAGRTIRVDLERVDRLVNLVGEVLIAQAALATAAAAYDGTGALDTAIEALGRETRELQECVMAIRAQPLRAAFQRLPRIVRDLADKLGKEARLVTTGEDVEVDTTVIEELHEPLVHMLRNAMDHGVEMPDARAGAGKPRAGTLRLAAAQRGGRVEITLADDGRGVDREAVLARARAKGLVPEGWSGGAEEIDQLIFRPGFSTAAQVSEVSGRGVGMDVVRQKIQSLGGRCTVRSRPGAGTEIVITLPLTLAVMDGMTVRVDGQDFIVPITNVVEALQVGERGVAELPDRTRILDRRGTFLPLVSLRTALSMPGGGAETTAVVVDTETGGHVALLVDDLVGQRQVVLKSLEGNVGRIDGISGATILGDGRVALVLDVPALVGGARHAPGPETLH